MGKIGKQRNLLILILIIFFSSCIYGFIWLCNTLQELRKYRGKGMPGWVVILPFLILLILPFLLYGLYEIYIPEPLFMLIPLIWYFILIVILVQGFHIPYNIDKEKGNLGLPKKKLVFYGFIPLLAHIIFYFTTSP